MAAISGEQAPLLLRRTTTRQRVSRDAAGAAAPPPLLNHGGATTAQEASSSAADQHRACDNDGGGAAALLCSPLCCRLRPAAGLGGGNNDTNDTNTMLSVLVHGCSAPLAPADGATNAAVRLHLVSAATGEYLRLQQPPADSGADISAAGAAAAAGAGDGNLNQNAAAPSPSPWLVGRATQADMLEYAGRPCLSTLGNDTTAPAPALLRYLPPLQTRPCDLAAMSAAAGAAVEAEPGAADSGGLPAPAPQWHEALELDVGPHALADADALLLLEVLEVPGSFREGAAAAAAARGGGGGGGGTPAGRRVAWGFARLAALGVAGLDGGAAGRRIEVQLYRYCHRRGASSTVDGGCMGRAAGNRPHPETSALAAFESWRATMAADAAAASSLPSSEGSGRSSNAVGISSPRSPRRGCAKYPSALVLSLHAVPRPDPSAVVADAARGVRPRLPAGYGSGFEVGRGGTALLQATSPWAGRLSGLRPSSAPCTLGGKALSIGNGGSFGGWGVDAAWPLGGSHAAAALAAERALHRPYAAPCEPPNAPAAAAPSPAGGCSALAFSRDGRWLAAACGRADGRACVALYHGPTLRPAARLGWHGAARVCAVAWAPDDSLVATAGGDDMTAGVWGVPWRRGAACGSARLLLATGGIIPSSSGDGSGSGSSSDEADTTVAVLQHACAVSDVAFCPLPGLAAPRLATAGADGVIRIWDVEGGGGSCAKTTSATTASASAAAPLLLFAAPGLGAPVTALAFDLSGARLYAGDAAGCVHEFAVELLPTAAATAAESAAAAAASVSGLAPPAAALRKLRDTGGAFCAGGVAQLRIHPGGRHLLALACGSGGGSNSGGIGTRRHLAGAPAAAVALDLKLLLPARRFGPGAASALAAPAVAMAASPDGRYVALISSDGAVTCHAFDGRSSGPLRLPALEGADASAPAQSRRRRAIRSGGAGAPRALDWSAGFNVVAACALSPYAPIVVACFDARQPPLRAPQPQQTLASDCRELPTPRSHARSAGAPYSGSGSGSGGARSSSIFGSGGGGSGGFGRLPERLAPEDVRAMLRALRDDATRRGLLPQKGIGSGGGGGRSSDEHLVVAVATAAAAAGCEALEVAANESAAAAGAT